MITNDDTLKFGLKSELIALVSVITTHISINCHNNITYIVAMKTVFKLYKYIFAIRTRYRCLTKKVDAPTQYYNFEITAVGIVSLAILWWGTGRSPPGPLSLSRCFSFH